MPGQGLTLLRCASSGRSTRLPITSDYLSRLCLLKRSHEVRVPEQVQFVVAHNSCRRKD
jgi:hypothetical protein